MEHSTGIFVEKSIDRWQVDGILRIREGSTGGRVEKTERKHRLRSKQAVRDQGSIRLQLSRSMMT